VLSSCAKIIGQVPMGSKKTSHEKFCRRVLMKVKHSIKIDHDESPSTVDEVVNSKTNIVVGNERSLINVKNVTHPHTP
jgi:hypothetical protein